MSNYKGECKHCGRKLYEAMVTAWPNTTASIISKKIPDNLPAIKQITMDLQHVKEFNASFMEVSEFAAWVCGVDVEKFCRGDMMKYEMQKIQDTK